MYTIEKSNYISDSGISKVLQFSIILINSTKTIYLMKITDFIKLYKSINKINFILSIWWIIFSESVLKICNFIEINIFDMIQNNSCED